ncbi:hypothetical protein Droror1_Dr00011300 [Drosera rotundifolia]
MDVVFLSSYRYQNKWFIIKRQSFLAPNRTRQVKHKTRTKNTNKENKEKKTNSSGTVHIGNRCFLPTAGDADAAHLVGEEGAPMATAATTVATSITKFRPLLRYSAAGRRLSTLTGGAAFRFGPLRRSGRNTMVKLSFEREFRANAVASSLTIEVETIPEPNPAEDISPDVRASVLACPICYEGLIWSGESLSIEAARGATLECNACKKRYYGEEVYLDLTAASGSKDYVPPMPLSTEFFRTPFMSFLYERGWRQNFGLGGYPGPEKEFEMAKGYLKPVLGGNIVDASCGSGLFSRLFAKNGLFSLVVALDYSEAMLRQCYEFVQAEESFPKENLILVRADIARLPFVSGSVDAVHAGAALHCWPSPSIAVAEISRVLRPGGVFVATTTIADGPVTYLPFVPTFREYLAQFSGGRIFLSEGELEDLCSTCGLVDFTCVRNGFFVMISATKPT